jgi:hypothetical protein
MQRLGVTVADQPGVSDSAKAALDRIDVSADIRERIETALSDGSSITINDQGIGPDTGDGTDFITITNSQPGPATVETISSTPRPAKPRSVGKYRSVGLY